MIKKEFLFLLIVIQILIIGYLVNICWESFSSITNTFIDISMLIVILSIFLFWGYGLYLQFKNLIK